ncbi:MAG: lamin tail domain-containing protein, partial [Myxococcota bacterium]
VVPTGPGARFDEDGDGWSAADGDCDDHKPGFNPAALDRPGDGRDEDCDGADDLGLSLAGVLAGDLVVTEFMAEPLGVSGGLGEWFEVHAVGAEAIDLAGLVVTDRGNDDFIVGGSVIVEAGGYAVLGGWADPEVNGGVEVDYRYEADFGLSNAEDAIVLSYATRTLDEVAYDPSWALTGGLLEGRSMARDAAGAWCPGEAPYGTGGWGSPGDENPPCPPRDGVPLADVPPDALVITEVMQNPSAVDGDFGEWFELHNTLDRPVDLRGLVVSDDDGDSFTVEAYTELPAGGELVLGAFDDPSVNGGAPIDVPWRWTFDLANSGDTIRIARGIEVLDEVRYDDGATFPDPEGASMSLDPAKFADNALGASWCVAETPYGPGIDRGTPGAPNPSCPPPVVVGAGDVVITEVMADPLAVDGDSGEWFELYAPGAVDVDLGGFTIRDDDGEAWTVPAGVRVPAGGYAVSGGPVTSGTTEVRRSTSRTGRR